MNFVYNNISISDIWAEAVEKFDVQDKVRDKNSASARAAMVEVLKEVGYTNMECAIFINKSYEQVTRICRQGYRGLGYTTEYYYEVRAFLRERVFGEVNPKYESLAIEVTFAINSFREKIKEANKALSLVGRSIDYSEMDDLQIKIEKLIRKV